MLRQRKLEASLWCLFLRGFLEAAWSSCSPLACLSEQRQAITGKLENASLCLAETPGLCYRPKVSVTVSATLMKVEGNGSYNMKTRAHLINSCSLLKHISQIWDFGLTLQLLCRYPQPQPDCVSACTLISPSQLRSR